LINRHQSTPAASKSDSARSSRRWNAVETAQTCRRRRRHRRHANSRLRRASVDYNELSSSDLVKTGARTHSRRLRLSVTLAELSALTEPQKSMAECMRLGVHARTGGRTCRKCNASMADMMAIGSNSEIRRIPSRCDLCCIGRNKVARRAFKL